MAFLNRTEVKQILAYYRDGWGYRNIARMMGIRERVVENVLTGRTYRSITGGRICNGQRPKKSLAIYSGEK